MFQANQSFITSKNSCSIAVYESGKEDGYECLFIHGFAMDHSVWWNQFLSPLLQKHCRLIAIDLRGHGRSGRPETREDYISSEIWAADLAAVIKGKKLDRPVLIPWSFGGRIVNDYISHYGQSRLSGINYVAAASVSDPDIIRPGHALLNAICSQDVDPDKRRSVIDQYVNKLFQQNYNYEAFQFLCSVVESIPVETKKYLRERVLDYNDLLPEINIPVLATHGELDCMFDPDMSRRLANRVRKGRVSVYPDAGHAPFYDCPKRFNKELLEFVRHCRRGQ